MGLPAAPGKDLAPWELRASLPCPPSPPLPLCCGPSLARGRRGGTVAFLEQRLLLFWNKGPSPRWGAWCSTFHSRQKGSREHHSPQPRAWQERRVDSSAVAAGAVPEGKDHGPRGGRWPSWPTQHRSHSRSVGSPWTGRGCWDGLQGAPHGGLAQRCFCGCESWLLGL